MLRIVAAKVSAWGVVSREGGLVTGYGLREMLDARC